MRRRPISILVLAAMLLPAAGSRAQQSPPSASQQPAAPEPAPQQSPQKIITVVNLVDVLFTVLNHRNKLVTDLDQGDFKVFDDGHPQDIRWFSRQTDLPLRVGMLLDTSNSIRGRIQFEQDAAVDFLFSVLRHGRDQAFVMTFDDEPYVVQAFTDDGGMLRDEIMKTRPGGATAVYDAIYTACRDQLSHPPRPAGDRPDVVRRVMILISDGEDNLSQRTRAEAIEMAQRASVVIYTISTSMEWSTTTDEKSCHDTGKCKYHLTEGDDVLQQIADETGGRAFFPYHVDDLDQSFQAIGEELRSQYSLAYAPSNYVSDGRYHKIRIEIPERKGLQVRARRGYYARSTVIDPAAKPSGN